MPSALTAEMLADTFAAKSAPRPHVEDWIAEHGPGPPCDERPPDLREEELRIAIEKNNTRAVQDPDGLTATHLRYFGPRAREHLLALFNKTLTTGRIPALWKSSVVTPVLKEGANPLADTSYRPVSNTSYVCRTMERMIYIRLTTRISLSPRQFGYRRHLSAEWAVSHVVLTVLDAMRLKNNNRTQHASAAVLFDFSDAFCRMNPDRLVGLLKKHQVPDLYVTWISDYLKGRSLAVAAHGTKSTARPTPWGCPQGTILGAFLWDVFIDDLAVKLHGVARSTVSTQNHRTGSRNQSSQTNQGTYASVAVEVALVADDLTVWARAPTMENLARCLQPAVNQVLQWSTNTGVPLSSKTKVICFNGGRPTPTATPIALDWSAIPWGPSGPPTVVPPDQSVRLLGLWLDRALTFHAHVEKLIATLQQVLQHLSSAALLAHPHGLRSVYHAVGLSRIFFGCGTWWHLISETQKLRLSRIHIAACRIIVGATHTTPNSSVLAEAGMRDLPTMMKAVAIRTFEKAYRLPSEFPFALALRAKPLPLGGTDVPDRSTFRTFGGPATQPFKECLLLAITPPYRFDDYRALRSSENVRFLVTPPLAGITAKSSVAEKLQANQDRLKLIGPCDIEIWPDGSFFPPDKDHPQARTGAAVVIYLTDGQPPVILKEALGMLPCCYSAERHAVKMGLEHLLFHLERTNAAASQPTKPTVLLATDSQSHLASLQTGYAYQPDAAQYAIWDLLMKISPFVQSITLAFLFSHCGLPRAVIADTAAKHAADLPIHAPPLWHVDASRQRTKVAYREYDASIGDTFRTKWYGPAPTQPSTRIKLSRKKMKLLLSLRVGVSKLIGGHIHNQVQNCWLCGLPALTRGNGAAVEHMFTCDAVDVTRRTRKIESPKDLWTNPLGAIDYVIALLKLRPPDHDSPHVVENGSPANPSMPPSRGNTQQSVSSDTNTPA